MRTKLFPGDYVKSIYRIDFKELSKQGYKAMLFDVDNTLVDHGAPADDRAKRFFKYLRNLRPDLPVLMLTMPYADFSNEKIQERRAIIARTWLNAFEAGDRNVEFLDGETFFAGSELRENCSSDCCHQNDLGEHMMAERIADRLKRMLPED